MKPQTVPGRKQTSTEACSTEKADQVSWPGGGSDTSGPQNSARCQGEREILELIAGPVTNKSNEDGETTPEALWQARGGPARFSGLVFTGRSGGSFSRVLEPENRPAVGRGLTLSWQKGLKSSPEGVPCSG